MGKIYGLNGALTGRQGGSVFAVVHGENIIRMYQPKVTNPSTEGQVAVRARFKLLTQFAAVAGPYIAIPRVGMKSSRNGFVAQNYKNTSYANSEANIALTDIQLTKSVVALPTINATRGTENISVGLAYADNELSRVVYVAFAKTSRNELRYFSSVVVQDPGANGHWDGILPFEDSPVVLYAYGVRDNTENAKAIFSNMTVLIAETVAKVIVTRTLTDADITLTETRAVELAAG